MKSINIISATIVLIFAINFLINETKNKTQIIEKDSKIYKIMVTDFGRKAYVFELRNKNDIYILKYKSISNSYTMWLVKKTIFNSRQNLERAFESHQVRL